MDFYQELQDRNLLDLIKRVPYTAPSLAGWERVREFLLDIVVNKKSVYIEGDYDVDGLCSALVLQESLKDLGVKNYYVYRYRKRTHSVDSVAIQQCVQGHYDYFIVADTGSSDLGLLKKLNQYGIKVIVLDHHNTDLVYEDFGDNIAIINTTLENALGADLHLSAGALCFIVMDLLYHALGKKIPASFSAFAVVSLFSDVISMKDSLNRGLYYLAAGQPEEQLPMQVTYFKNDYTRFNARHIGYWYAPRINACFRSEQFQAINYLFFDNITVTERAAAINDIENIYTKSRDLVKVVSDIILNFCVELKNFVYTDLGKVSSYYDVETHKLYNYTGLVANQISSVYGKTAVVTCGQLGSIKGSLRDFCGRNYLPVFKQICKAGGHDAAFGFRLNALDYKQFICDLNNIDQKFSIDSVGNAPIIIEIGDWEPADEIMLADAALYNEFASPGVPVVLVRKRITGAITERKTDYNYKYNWDGVEIQSNSRIAFGHCVDLKPILSWKLKLLNEQGVCL